MAIASSVELFLGSVYEVARDFSGFKTGDDLIPLYHNFWPPDEIADGRAIKGVWDVPEDLIPFYGDWHTLLCISVRTGEIFLLNDERTTLFAWKDSKDFLSCLTTDPVMEKPSSTHDGIIEGETWIDF